MKYLKKVSGKMYFTDLSVATIMAIVWKALSNPFTVMNGNFQIDMLPKVALTLCMYAIVILYIIGNDLQYDGKNWSWWEKLLYIIATYWIGIKIAGIVL